MLKGHDNVVRFVLKGEFLPNLPLVSDGCAPDGIQKNEQNFEEIKAQIQKIDGSVIKVPEDLSYVDITVPEGNFNLIEWVTFTFFALALVCQEWCLGVQ